MSRFLSLFVCLALCLGLLAGCAGSPAGEGVSAPVPTPAKEEGLFPAGEYRAIWISYLEWQTVDFSSRESYTADVCRMLDNCADLGLNVVLAQVRPFGDALYPSEIFPFSHLCTGTQGQDPGYDPLEILLEEAHSRGLQLEAWLNPYRLRLNDTLPAALAKDNLANLYPGWTKPAAGGLYLDPSDPDVRAYIAAGVVELLENYNLDGIHLDDYFYPTTDPAFDREEYAASGTDLTLEDWRRENVNLLVQLLWNTVKHSGGENVRFGISPQGNNSNNFNTQYSDLALWLSTPGYIDYAAPQLYWGNGHRLSSGSDSFAFGNVAARWAEMDRTPGVRLIFGLGAYRIGDGDDCPEDAEFWASGSSMASQVEESRRLGADGFALYRYDHLFKNTVWAQLALAETDALKELF